MAFFQKIKMNFASQSSWISESPPWLFILPNETNPAEFSFLKFFFNHSLLDSALKVEVNYHASTAWEWRDGSMVQLFSSDRTYACLKSMEKWWIIHKKFWMKWFLKRKGGQVSLNKKKKSTYFFTVTAKLLYLFWVKWIKTLMSIYTPG